MFCCLVVSNSWKNYGYSTDIDLLFLVSEAFFTEFVRISIPQGFVISIFSNCEKCYWLLVLESFSPGTLIGRSSSLLHKPTILLKF
jgi:hypothetical protein